MVLKFFSKCEDWENLFSAFLSIPLFLIQNTYLPLNLNSLKILYSFLHPLSLPVPTVQHTSPGTYYCVAASSHVTLLTQIPRRPNIDMDNMRVY